MLWLIVLALKLSNSDNVSKLGNTLFKSLSDVLETERKWMKAHNLRDSSIRILFAGAEADANGSYFSGEELFEGFYRYQGINPATHFVNKFYSGEEPALQFKNRYYIKSDFMLLAPEWLDGKEIFAHGNSAFGAAVNSFGKILDLTYDRVYEGEPEDQVLAERRVDLEEEPVRTFKLEYSLLVGSTDPEEQKEQINAVAANFVAAEAYATAALLNAEKCPLLPDNAPVVRKAGESCINFVHRLPDDKQASAPAFDKESAVLDGLQTFQENSLLVFTGEPADFGENPDLVASGAEWLAFADAFKQKRKAETPLEKRETKEAKQAREEHIKKMVAERRDVVGKGWNVAQKIGEKIHQQPGPGEFFEFEEADMELGDQSLPQSQERGHQRTYFAQKVNAKPLKTGQNLSETFEDEEELGLHRHSSQKSFHEDEDEYEPEEVNLSQQSFHPDEDEEFLEQRPSKSSLHYSASRESLNEDLDNLFPSMQDFGEANKSNISEHEKLGTASQHHLAPHKNQENTLALYKGHENQLPLLQNPEHQLVVYKGLEDQHRRLLL